MQEGQLNLKVSAVSLLILGWIWATCEAALPEGNAKHRHGAAFAKRLSEEHKTKILHTQRDQVWLCAYIYKRIPACFFAEWLAVILGEWWCGRGKVFHFHDYLCVSTVFLSQCRILSFSCNIPWRMVGLVAQREASEITGGILEGNVISCTLRYFPLRELSLLFSLRIAPCPDIFQESVF